MYIETISLVDHSHHELRFAGMNQLRDQAGLLDLVNDPVPVAGGLNCYRCGWLTVAQSPPDYSGPMIDPDVPLPAASHVFSRESVLLVAVE